MKTYIWTWPTRLFHWMLAAGFTAAFLLGGEEEFINWHAALGTLVGCLVLFRILQGFTGPKYARFRDFPVSPASLVAFLKNMKQSNPRRSQPGSSGCYAGDHGYRNIIRIFRYDDLCRG